MPVISAKFHNGLVVAILAVAKQLSAAQFVFTGGCFLHKNLTRKAGHPINNFQQSIGCTEYIYLGEFYKLLPNFEVALKNTKNFSP